MNETTNWRCYNIYSYARDTYVIIINNSTVFHYASWYLYLFESSVRCILIDMRSISCNHHEYALFNIAQRVIYEQTHSCTSWILDRIIILLLLLCHCVLDCPTSTSSPNCATCSVRVCDTCENNYFFHATPTDEEHICRGNVILSFYIKEHT